MITTIALDTTTKEKLENLRKYRRESYEDIILRLLGEGEKE